MSPPAVDFWFEFASSYSYPAIMRIGGLAEQAGVAITYRPFLLGPIFKAQGWDTSPFNLFPVKGRYMWRDIERICATLDLPLLRPEVFPQSGLIAARLALVGLAHGWGEAFCRAVYRAEFGEGRRIDNAETIGAILAGLGLEASTVMAASQDVAIKEQLRAQTVRAQELGIFGAPTFITADGELFWGNDRLESALAWTKHPWAKQHG
jgi:2-hydroxychromene-2-carboxylate isomerase